MPTDLQSMPSLAEPPIRVVVAEAVDASPTPFLQEDRPPSLALKQWPKSWPMRCWYSLCWTLEWLFGLASVVAFLAVLAAVPILNFVSLGYLLEASGRVARS